MEDAAEAIKIAGFTLIFVTALSIAMITVMQGKRTSETIISYSDKTKYYSMVEQQTDTSGNGILTNNEGNRIVTVYDIIPTLYRYQQEKYIVVFEGITVNFNGYIKDNTIIEGKTNISNIPNIASSPKFNDITYLNHTLEDNLGMKWTNNYKGHVDYVVKQLLSKYNDASNTFIETISTTYDLYYDGINNENTRQKTKEEINGVGFKRQTTQFNTNGEENEKIRVIRYTLQL